MARLNPNIHESLTEDVLGIFFSKKIYTIIDFLEADAKNLTKITTLNFKQIIDIRKIILQKYSAPIVTGLTVYNDQLERKTLTTCIKNLDNLIGGGLSSGFIYELFGSSAVGKTQMCFTIAINIAQYLKQPVFYIDTKRDFSARRLKNMLDARQCSEEESSDILLRIKVKMINDRFELVNNLYEIKNKYCKDGKAPIIIIDSLPTLFYTIGEFNAVLSMLNQFVNILRYICVELHTSAIVTNILLPKFSKDGECITQIRPGLGKYWDHVPSARILINKDEKSDVCNLSVTKSTFLKCGDECNLLITESGVM